MFDSLPITAPPDGEILIIGPIPPPLHGMSVVTAAMAEHLSSVAPCPVRVLSVSPGSLRRGLLYHIRKLRRVVRAAATLARVRRDRPRTVYMSVDAGAGVLYNLLIVCLARRAGCRIFLHHHSSRYLQTRSASISLLDRIAGSASHHICLCEALRHRFLELYHPRGSVILLSNAAFIPTVQRRAPSGVSLRLGHLSNLSAAKGFYAVVRLLECLTDRGIQATLTIAGPPHTTEVAGALDDLRRRHEGRVKYLGPIEGEMKQDFFKKIDVFVFPTTHTEAQPLVVLEALASGIPCITYGRGCAGTDVGDSGGLVVPPGEDFVTRALPYLEHLAQTTSAVEDAARAANLTYSSLRHTAGEQLRNVTDLLLPRTSRP